MTLPALPQPPAPDPTAAFDWQKWDIYLRWASETRAQQFAQPCIDSQNALAAAQNANAAAIRAIEAPPAPPKEADLVRFFLESGLFVGSTDPLSAAQAVSRAYLKAYPPPVPSVSF